MTPSEFRAALECWQLEVDEFTPRRVVGEIGYPVYQVYDVIVAYGERAVCKTIAVLNERWVLSLAMDVLGACYDCSGRPIHPNVKSHGGTMCRECTIKGGEFSDFRHTFDLDKLRQKLGPAELRLLIQTCSWEGPE